MKIQAVGGQMIFKKLTNEVEEKEFAIRKAYIWLNMLNDGMKPVKWLKPTKKGTKVNFEIIRSEEELNKGLDELDTYLYDINKRFGTDLKIKRG
jgi:hypothetical protein